MNKSQPLPRSVQEIADVIGRDAALLLIKSSPRNYSPCHPSGRVILYVPKTIRPDHHLVRVLGWELADKLVRAFGGEFLRPADCWNLSRSERDAAIRTMLRERSVMDVAEHFGLSDRQVRNIAREIPEVAANENNVNTAAA